MGYIVYFGDNVIDLRATVTNMLYGRIKDVLGHERFILESDERISLKYRAYVDKEDTSPDLYKVYSGLEVRCNQEDSTGNRKSPVMKRP